MIVGRLKRHPDLEQNWFAQTETPTGDVKPYVYGDGPWIMVEVEVTNPPSMEGRKVMLYLEDQDVTDLLLVLRRRAIEIRRQPMSA